MGRIAYTLLVAATASGLTLWYGNDIKGVIVGRFSKEKPAIVQEFNPKIYAPSLEQQLEPESREGLRARIMDGLETAKSYITGKNDQQELGR